MKNMLTSRNFIITIGTAALISLSMIAGYHFLVSKDKTDSIQIVENVPKSNVLYAPEDSGNFTPLDFTETSKGVLDAVVHIKTFRKRQMDSENYNYRQLPDSFKDFFGDFFFQRPDTPRENPSLPPIAGSGSGVIINDKGYIVTNNHVIDEADEIEVTLHSNETYKAAVVGTDPTTDLALIQIKKEGLKPLKLVNSDNVQIGEWVLAVGNPFSLTSTVTAGIVSAKARNININKEEFAVESFIQTDAAINPGNSGGALVNLKGQLIGINTAIASRTGSYSGYGFAIPSNIVGKVIEDLLHYGSVQRGMLGVVIRTMDGKFAKEKDIDFTKGVWVDKINEGSAAEKAGVKTGDIILSVDAKEVTTSPELQEIIARHRPGDEVVLEVLRGKERKKLSVTLENMAGNPNIVNKENREIMGVLGADLETLNRNTAKKLGLSGGIQVKRLYAGKLRRETQMREGFIITHVDGKKVKDLENLADNLDKKSGGVMLEGIYEDLPGKHYYAFGM